MATRGNLRVTDTIVIPASELDITFVRASGPGGQNVNKVASKAVVRFALRDSPSLPDDAKERALVRLAARLTREGELIVTSAATRDQSRNRAAALARLAQLLAGATRRPRVRRPTRPSAAAVERRLEAKRRRALVKRARTGKTVTPD
jgi:ribosome-associated protein